MLQTQTAKVIQKVEHNYGIKHKYYYFSVTTLSFISSLTHTSQHNSLSIQHIVLNKSASK